MTLADAIIEGNQSLVADLLRYSDVNQIDEYGFTPLIEAAIIDNIEISRLLLSHGANPNQQDVTGNTALHWACENNNKDLAKLLLKHRANPDAYNFAGQPVLVMPTLRQQREIRKILIEAGANEIFAADYINTKLLGHMFELVGTASIISPAHQYVEVDFEGFFLEVTLGIISDALFQFQNHFAARELRKYSGLAQFIAESLKRALNLIRFQQYQTNINLHLKEINELIEQEPLVIPVGYEGHAITFIRYGNIWTKCDRREDSRLYDNIVFYQITQPQNLTTDLIKLLIYQKQSYEFINQELDKILGLTPITELKVEAQISGNCSWANVEAVIPSIFFLVLMQMNKNPEAVLQYKTLSLQYFTRFREWNKERSFHYCVESFKNGDAIRKASKAEILAAILFERLNTNHPKDREYIETILSLLINSRYEYILKNYLRIYYYESNTNEGKQFFHLLKEYGLDVR